MQPKNVLYEYLADLICEPGTQHSAETVAGVNRCAQPATATSDSGDERHAGSTADRPLRAAAVLSAGEHSPDRLNAEQHSVTGAGSPGIPEWAANPFQVLMFRLRGVNLGVPLHDLDSITRWNGRSTSIPGQPEWQFGLFLHNRRKVSLVDLSSLIMPERNTADTTAAAAGYLLLVGNSRWGLVCDSIQRPRLVRAGDVRWNRNRQVRPWSHGIIVENLSVLLNVDALLGKLGTNDA